ncbi:MAG: flagellar biosynthetic protein FliO [Pseudomonadales bacterium]|nr:flagellar biosynthetic protein FliO [Pseudomonadales bacterium]
MSTESLINPLQIIFSLALVIGLIFACAWIVRRTNGVKKFQTNLMSVKSVLSVGPKEKIMIVQVGKEQLLLSVCTGQIILLKTLDEPIEVEKPKTSDFSEKILQLIQGGKVAKNKQQSDSDKKEVSNTSGVISKESI